MTEKQCPCDHPTCSSQTSARDAGGRYYDGMCWVCFGCDPGAEARCLAEHGERWRALYRTPWARYEATLAVPALEPLRRLAREELGDQAPASDAAYKRAWYEASRWAGGGIAPEHRRDTWLDS